MIDGGATANGTADYGDRFPDIAYRNFGSTTWNVSAAGFGCYRVSADVNDHAAAMTRAIGHGINLIDTSANYTDGASERLVGQVLESLVQEKRLQREQVVVVSKVGYLQGRNFALSEQRKKERRPFPDLVAYAPQLEHCIHPEFIADQLERSLNRLQLKTLDVLLLHNPEYYLGWSARQEMDREAARRTFYKRIENAFRYLEQEAARGRIQAYGVSANTFVAGADEAGFVSLERIWKIACDIRSDHHFRVIQLPMNLYESGAVTEPNQSGGQSTIAVARRHGLGVLVNRPLNAFHGRRLVRLADGKNKEARMLKQTVAAVDSDWADAAGLSRQALRAVRSTAGVSSVLVGMRQTNYVDDVLQELRHPVQVVDRTESWYRLKRALKSFNMN
jgi:aryl-alcohol dehydrogenase-like predicted oxidoreductase